MAPAKKRGTARKPAVRISVREAVERCFRSGDLKRASIITGVEGTRAHQRVQKARPETYQPEVRLQYSLDCEDFKLTFHGRVDGLVDLHPKDAPPDPTRQVVIEEIKSTRRPLLEIEAREIHWAQARIYAFIYAKKHGLEAVELHLTYVELVAFQERTFRETWSFAELEAFFKVLTDRLVPLTRQALEWKALRNQSILHLDFPFQAPRRGQFRFMREVNLRFDHSQELFIEAPTGIGKTIAAVFPAVKALGQGRFGRIVFLTAKNSGKHIARQAFERLRSENLRLKVITLTAKDKLTCVEGERCDPMTCENAVGYFDRLPGAMKAMFAFDIWDPERIAEIARKHAICPFEFSLDLSTWADVVICDVNYFFDPRVVLRRLFEVSKEKNVLLIDEAHNLVGRARDMFSASLSLEAIRECSRTVSAGDPALARALDKLGFAMETAAKGPGVQLEKPKQILRAVREFHGVGEAWLSSDQQVPWKDFFLETVFEAASFLQAGDRFDDDFRFFHENERDGLVLKIFCLDPGRLLKRARKKAESTIFFSATLSPADYYLDLLGADPPFGLVQLPSPFPTENLEIFAGEHLSTTYRERDENYKPIAKLVSGFCRYAPGNILVFFPSYVFMQSVANFFDPPEGAEWIVQRRDMSENARNLYLNLFTQGTKPAIGFAVMGGIFGEGIDLIGDALNAAVMVGVALPQVGMEQNLIKGYFEGKGKQGFDYAYTYPGISRVLQAAGRVIRSETDQGKLLLIDRRYGTPKYAALFPEHWPEIQWARKGGKK